MGTRKLLQRKLLTRAVAGSLLLLLMQFGAWAWNGMNALRSLYVGVTIVGLTEDRSTYFGFLAIPVPILYLLPTFGSVWAAVQAVQILRQRSIAEQPTN